MRTFTVDPSRETENYMEMCLGLFYAPSRSIPEDVSSTIMYYHWHGFKIKIYKHTVTYSPLSFVRL